MHSLQQQKECKVKEVKNKQDELFVTYAAFATLAYYGTYLFNAWFFSSVSIAPHLSLIYLPAAVRMLFALVLGLPAAIGMSLGTLLIIYTTQGSWTVVWYEAIPVSLISGFAPLLAVMTGVKWLKLPDDLGGLKPSHLIKFTLLGALCNSIPTNAFYWAVGHLDTPLPAIAQMFAGDVLGTLLVLWIAACIAKLVHPQRMG